MNKFKRKYFNSDDIQPSDNGIKVSELLTLIQGNVLSDEILKFIKIDKMENDVINIAGARTLFDNQSRLNKQFYKIDLTSKLEDITLYSKGEFTINFNNTISSDYLKDIKVKSIISEPIYSASRDFFSNLYSMDRYANRLIETKNRAILEANLKLLKPVLKSKEKRYRLLHDTIENKFYLRAIISLNNYYNYDNNIAIVLGLLTLHNEMKKGKTTYFLKRCEYNESYIRMFFESSVQKKLETIGKVKNILEISNDEIKKEALRFSGVCLIEFGKDNKTEGEIYIKPHETKSKILSVRHNQGPVSAIKELGNIDSTNKVHEELYDDILKIVKIRNPEQIKFLVKNKIENAKNDQVKRLKLTMLRELDNTVSNVIQLLSAFRKIELLANEDIEVSEYIRFVIYQALIERK